MTFFMKTRRATLVTNWKRIVEQHYFESSAIIANEMLGLGSADEAIGGKNSN